MKRRRAIFRKLFKTVKAQIFVQFVRKINVAFFVKFIQREIIDHVMCLIFDKMPIIKYMRRNVTQIFNILKYYIHSFTRFSAVRQLLTLILSGWNYDFIFFWNLVLNTLNSIMKKENKHILRDKRDTYNKLSGRFKSKVTDFVSFISKIHISRYVSNFYLF